MDHPDHIRILIADDHLLFREGVEAILESEGDIEIVGEAGTGQETVQLVGDLSPDVILMDIQMPDMNGIEATRRILAAMPDTRIIIVTMLEDDESLLSAMKAGALGYVLKGADKAEMLRSIRAAAAGEALFGREIAAKLTGLIQKTASTSEQPYEEIPFPELTAREREVLTMMSGGMDNTEIARTLTLSVKTIQNHITNIYNKLQVSDRTHAVLKARDAGLGSPQSDPDH